ncbi:uncharacterized protein BJX67DRAFT_372964 [Aspergillus lucknowensis]|uniref:rRNA adenine N(6)-methyltransferase n=1 Tax=Aspergillus lucknowensis TaxID=176173 RepID=A0ABR4LMT2_9EURO
MCSTKVNRWTPLAQFPVTKALSESLPRFRTAIEGKPHIVSEPLCDDIVQRLSPFLLRNRPVDILDLWPGPGILSSKVNDLLKPRRHVLIESDLEHYRSLLAPLAESRPCYELVSMDKRSLSNWETLLTEYFPDQGPSNSDKSGALARNDTLLVLANPPPAANNKDHFSGSRWLSVFMETCLQQTGLHAYGSVRLLASMTNWESSMVLPRTITQRTRPAVLTEQLAIHAFEVAAPEGSLLASAASQRQYDMLVGSASRTAQRTSENKTAIPAGRKFPAFELAPHSPSPGRKPVPYTPRVRTDQNKKYVRIFEEFDQADTKSPELRKKRSTATAQLNQENREAYIREVLTTKQAELDELNKSISRLAADPNSTLESLGPVVEEIKALRKSIAKQISEHHFDVTRPLSYLIDNRRAAFYTGSFDDAVLLWDRRPFEPLLVHPNEYYPREKDRTVVYFEANPNAPVAQVLRYLTPEQREAAWRAFDALSFSIATANALTLSKLAEILLPNHSCNEIIKTVPSLAKYASKHPKPDFDTLPKTLHYSKPDPISCYQENLDYDLSGVRARIVAASTLWELFAAYAKNGGDHSVIQLCRFMGGTLTSAHLGRMEAVRMR